MAQSWDNRARELAIATQQPVDYDAVLSIWPVRRLYNVQCTDTGMEAMEYPFLGAVT
jgi:hypothetical protein